MYTISQTSFRIQRKLRGRFNFSYVFTQCIINKNKETEITCLTYPNQTHYHLEPGKYFFLLFRDQIVHFHFERNWKVF